MTSTISAIGWTLIDFLWQGAVIGLATALLFAAMRRAAPSQRYLVGCAALLACVAWPAWTLAGRLAAPDAGTTVQLTQSTLALAVSARNGVGALVENHLPLIVLGWAACAAALGLRMSIGLLWIARSGASRGRSDIALQWRLQRLAEQFGITREVRIRIVEHLASPITAGWLRPVILVPASLVTGMPPDLLDALLAHEMAHIKRFDYLVNLCQNVIETLLFYHPAVWWISRQVRAEREKIADDFAASKLGEPRRLALALSELEKIQFSHHHLAVPANGGDLMDRIKRLIKPETHATNWKAALPVAALVFAAFAAQFPQTAYADAPANASSTDAVVHFASCAKPKYPAEALKLKQTGTVTLAFDVDAHGKATASRVQKSSGSEQLDEAARVAIEKCSFEPATKDGKPMASTSLIQYVWTLD